MSDEGAPSPARLPTVCPAGPEGVICAEEIRARRLVICDEAGRERIVAGLSFGVAEVRVTLDAGDNRSPAVLLTAGGDPDLGSTVGLSLFADGDAVATLRATEGVGGVWRTEVWSRAHGGRRVPHHRYQGPAARYQHPAPPALPGGRARLPLDGSDGLKWPHLEAQ